MSSRTFQFSSAAQLYCENVAVVDEIKRSKSTEARKLYKEYHALISEMRTEAYQTIATFADLVLKDLALLPWDRHGVRFCQKRTHTVKSWKGQAINYRWLRPATEQGNAKEWKEGGCVALAVPTLSIIKGLDDDTNLRSHFDVLTKQQLTVGLVCVAPIESRRRLVATLARNSEFGTFLKMDTTATWNNISMPIDPDDPITPVVARIAALLRAIYAIEYSRQEPG